MGPTFIITILIALLAFGLNIYGLFNKRRSIPCILAGLLTALLAAPGALHAWGESQSVPWTIGYLTVMLVGITCVVRQFLLGKQRSEIESC